MTRTFLTAASAAMLALLASPALAQAPAGWVGGDYVEEQWYDDDFGYEYDYGYDYGPNYTGPFYGYGNYDFYDDGMYEYRDEIGYGFSNPYAEDYYETPYMDRYDVDIRDTPQRQNYGFATPGTDGIAQFDGYDYDYNFADIFQRPREGWSEHPAQQGQQQRQQRSLRGEVVGLSRVTPGSGAPEAVLLELRTTEGRTRQLLLGDVDYASQNLPPLSPGDRVAIGGTTTKLDGQEVFRAQQIDSPQGVYRIPEYQCDRTVRGRLVGVQRVATRDGQITALLATVRDQQGDEMRVLLGQPSNLREAQRVLRPGADIRVKGYARTIDGQRTFVVQKVSLRQPQSPQGKR